MDLSRRSTPLFAVCVSLLLTLLLTPAYASADRRARTVPNGGLSCLSAECGEAFYHFQARQWSAAASAFEQAVGPELRAGGNWADATLLLIGAARSFFRAGSFIDAGHRWQRVASLSSTFDDLAHYRALASYTRADDPPRASMTRLLDSGALDVEFPGVSLTRLRVARHLQRPTSSAEIDRALTTSRSDTCRWLSAHGESLQLSSEDDESNAQTRLDSTRAYLWSECIGIDDVTPPASLDSPSVPARLRRATRLFDLVRYDDALDELASVDPKKVSPPSLQCRFLFRLARTQERRDQHSTAASHYQQIVDACGDTDAEDAHIRSLYALGDHHYDREHYDASQTAFEAILQTYPQRSHADDALLYLGRIARERGNRNRQAELLERALSTYPDGDMVHEFAWEYLEPRVRDDQWETFLQELDSLDLPDHDEQPYSQGRLGYFRARAHRALERPDRAADIWAQTWRDYPFSFYGYLSRMHLGPDDAVDTELMPASRSPAGWFLMPDEDIDATPAAGPGTRRLLSAGFTSLALTYERARNYPSDVPTSIRRGHLWRVAALWDQLGEFHHSHNVARLRIDRRPWVQPSRGRLTRWSVAYPDAYQPLITRAVLAEMSEHDDAEVQPALASALIREESAFLHDVESWAGALGLMQLMPATARGHARLIDGEATRETLLSPWPNIRIGVGHLFMLADDFSNHPVKMIAAYNAGGGAVSSWPADHTDIALWVEDIPYRQTRHYVKRVMGSYAAYQWLADRRLDPRIALKP